MLKPYDVIKLPSGYASPRGLLTRGETDYSTFSQERLDALYVIKEIRWFDWIYAIKAVNTNEEIMFRINRHDAAKFYYEEELFEEYEIEKLFSPSDFSYKFDQDTDLWIHQKANRDLVENWGVPHQSFLATYICLILENL